MLDNFFKIVVLTILPSLLIGVFLGYYEDPTRIWVDLGFRDSKDPVIVITEPNNNAIIQTNSNHFYVRGFASDESGIDKVSLRYSLEFDNDGDGDSDMTRFFTVPLNQDGSWHFPIGKNMNKKDQISNPITIIVKAEDRRGHEANEQITITIGKNELTRPVVVEPDVVVEDVVVEDVVVEDVVVEDVVVEPKTYVFTINEISDKSDGKLNDIINEYSKNSLIITGDVDTSDIQFKELKIRYFVDKPQNYLTEHKTIEKKEEFENTISWKYTIDNPDINKNFQIIIKVIDVNDKEYFIKYFIDLTKIHEIKQ